MVSLPPSYFAVWFVLGISSDDSFSHIFVTCAGIRGSGFCLDI